MQPKSNKPYTKEALQRFKEKIDFTRKCYAERMKDPTYAAEVPNEIGLKLTNRCDLRCTHCFQWNDVGFHRHLDKKEVKVQGDLDIDIIKKLLEETRHKKSHIYLWGGEPMIYTYWNELVELLANDPRDTVVCTNGLSIKRKIDSLVKISEKLTTLVSVEGLEAQHDKLRGKGTFKKIMDNVDHLIDLQQKGIYKGHISIAAVFSEDVIPHLYECCEYFESKGIDTLYFNFPWYIPEDEAEKMTDFYEEKYDWLEKPRIRKRTWESFDFHIDMKLYDDLLAQIHRILEKTWNIRIRFQPDLELSEIEAYLKGKSEAPSCKATCLGISNRMDVMPSGNVVSCKKFTEFKMGNLYENDMKDVWHGETFSKFRETHNNELMPICSKCEILFSNGM